MMMFLRYVLRKIKIAFFPYNLSNDEYHGYLAENGVSVGEGTVFYGPSLYTVDIQRPWLIDIGKYCKITEGVHILCHDYSRSVLRMAYGEIIAEAQKTHIGDNVFIGINSTILMGSNIGNNVIIGAGSVISGKIPDNVVAAGNPAKIIRTLEEHYTIRKNKYIDEAKQCALEFFKAYGRKPSIHDMGAFFPLYLHRSMDALNENNIHIRLGGDDYEDIINKFLASKSEYQDFEQFLDDIYWEQTICYGYIIYIYDEHTNNNESFFYK